MIEKSAEPEERSIWEAAHRFVHRRGDAFIHPCYRFPDWEAFCRAGKPWEHPGLPSNPKWEKLRDYYRRLNERHARRLALQREELRARAALPEQASVPPAVPAPGALLPASVVWKMMSDAQGGPGATGLSMSSPESAIRAHVEGIRRNGFKPPPGLSLS